MVGTESIKEVKTLENNWYNLGAWLVLTSCLSALLFYGLSFFVSRPTVETITVNPSNAVINSNQMQDIKFQHKTKKR